MGRKVLEAGGNHVLGYQQSFDLEGEHSGVIVARGLGTSVKLRPEVRVRVTVRVRVRVRVDMNPNLSLALSLPLPLPLALPVALERSLPG